MNQIDDFTNLLLRAYLTFIGNTFLDQYSEITRYDHFKAICLDIVDRFTFLSQVYSICILPLL